MFPPIKMRDLGREITVREPSRFSFLPSVPDEELSITPIRTSFEKVWLVRNGTKYETRDVLCRNKSTEFIVPVEWFLDVMDGKIDRVQTSDSVGTPTASQPQTRKERKPPVARVQAPRPQGGPSKKDAAIAVLREHKGISRREGIKLLVQLVGLTEKGAGTYYQLYRNM
jgi:hypothetical protein